MDCHYRSILSVSLLECMAGTTGLEPATSAVTGQRSDQLSYVPTSLFRHLDVCHIESSDSQKSLISLVSIFSLLWTRFWASIDTKQTPRRCQNGHCDDRNKSIRSTCFWGSLRPTKQYRTLKYCKYAGTPPAHLRGGKLPSANSAE